MIGGDQVAGTPSTATTLRLLALAVLVVTVSTQAVFLLGAAYFQIGPEMGVGTVGLGALTAAFFLTASATSAPLGRWVQRVGWQRAMRINLRVTAVVLTLIAGTARSPWLLGLFLVAAAAIYGASNPAANQALADHTDPDRQATVFGVKHAGIPASTLLAGLSVPLVIVQFGWRWAYLASAVLAIGVSFLVPRSKLESLGTRQSDGSRPTPSPMSTRSLLALALGSSFATWAAIALGTFLISASLSLGFSESAAGTLQFAGSFCSIAARIVSGVVTDRSGGRGYVGIALLTGLGAVAFLALPFASGAGFAVLVLVAFATGWGWPGLMTFAVVNANRRSAASSSAVTQAGVFVGAGLGPLILGGVIDRWSFDAAWVVVAVALVIAATVVTLVGRSLRRAENHSLQNGTPTA